MATHAEGSEADNGEYGGLIDVDFRKIWGAIVRNQIIIYSAIALSLLVGIAATLLMTPLYRAETVVQIEQQETKVLDSQDTDPVPTTAEADRFLKTQVEIIQSRTLALSVARKLGLIGNPRFLELMKVRKASDGPFTGKGPLSAADVERELVINTMLGSLSVDLPVDSRLVSIGFVSPDAKLSAQVANAYAEQFIEQNLQRKYDQSAYARRFLSEQLEEARQRLEQSEKDAIAYARQAQIIDTGSAAGSGDQQGGGSSRSLTTAALIELNNDYSEAVANRIKAEQKWRQASGSAITTLPEVLNNGTIQSLLQRKADLEAQYQDQRAIRQEEYPSVKRLAAQITELDSELQRIGNQIRSSFRSDYEVAQRQEESILSKLNALKADTLSEQDRNVKLSILRRASDTNRSLYDALLQRYRELSAEAGIQPNNISIVDQADVPPSPVSPKLKFNLLLSFLAGLSIAGLLVFMREHLDDTLRSAEDLRVKLGLALLGTVPFLKQGESVLDELRDPKSDVSEAFNSIRASLLLSSASGLPKTLLVTSAQPSEGKSTTSYALAVGLGRIGKRVVLVDMDMRRPNQHKLFELPNDLGASGLLTHSLTLDQAIKPTSEMNVSLITCGEIPPNPTELLSGSTLQSLLADLQSRFDTVIIDAPPILGLADAVMLASLADATVLVSESGRSHSGGARTSVSRLRDGHANIVGAILTKHDVTKAGYGYYDYNYSYKYRYGE